MEFYAGGVEWILIKDHSRLIESRVCGGGGVFIACSHFHPSVNLRPPFHYPSLPPRYHLLPTLLETRLDAAPGISTRWRFERGFTLENARDNDYGSDRFFFSNDDERKIERKRE